MSKFDEICQAYTTARQKSHEYREACWRFAAGLRQELASYLGCPLDLVDFVPLTKSGEQGVKYSPIEAMELQQDTFWHFGVALTVYQAPQVFPHQPLIFHFLLKKVDATFLVKPSPRGPEFSVDSLKPDFRPLNECVFSMARDFFNRSLQNFLGDDIEPKRIGF